MTRAPGPRRPRRRWKAGAALVADFRLITDKYPKLARTNNLHHLGTLGTGNHFVEICLDEEDRVWFMLHSGSRGVGNAIGNHFIELAKEDMRRWMINLPDKDLAYLPEGSEHFGDYVFAVDWAQRYARTNREIMMRHVVEACAQGDRQAVRGLGRGGELPSQLREPRASSRQGRAGDP